ncbi:Stk1 family PASTA domain-containing Ser/Thr kinase [Paenibacillus chartarius]|uniref:non-specific serine/threonine protein kinase n=1 Tax=Paenibacillus chartarius TaxID=747481 RepID=A0ABV6DTT8_9BACL
MIGKKLGGRYEILERIGGGGMALVYLGLDHLLHRKVAVKVLRQQYVHDEEFIRRFRREAQAAASLSHPNVVSIYDVGQEGDIHYIVMEYIEGVTLNDLIKERAPLQVEEAVRYASQICDALEHAHHNEIIHRDIKPHNILIGKNGRIKVTDFGIARAATSSTITQTGSVVGSVHYFSPEHAKGTSTGEKSDLYSLGIVLYQMLTGRLPFLGESPISVALKHLQEDVEEPRSVNPLIPQSVENIILKAMRKKPEERYQSATEMLADLETCLQPDRRNEPKIMFWHDEDGIDEESTRVIPAIRPNQYTLPPERSERNDRAERSERSEPLQEQRAEWRDEPVRRRGWIKPTVWIVILLLILGGMWYAVGWVKSIFTVPDITVPSVVGMNSAQAQLKLKESNLDPSVKEESDEKVPKDTVIRQDPEPNMKTKSRTVTIYVSTGAAKQKMPSLIGSNLKDARDRLQGLGLDPNTQIQVDSEFSDTAAVDTVMQQFPGVDESVDPKTVSVRLKVSKGKETFKMPDLVGKTLTEARKILTDNKLKLDEAAIKYETNFTMAKDKVVSQFPYKAGEDVSPNETIKLTVSSGPPADSGQLTVPVTLEPKEEGKESTFKITVSDATGDNLDYRTLKASKPTSVDVKVTVAPDKRASIQVKRDNELVNIVTKTYQDYLNQQSKPETGTGTQPSTNGTKPGTGGTTTPGGSTPNGPATPATGTGGTAATSGGRN